ncbi:MAG: DMT family transporter [Clostridiales bacterium]|nr:DMT family transporter [Clostridiales bacterium]
MKASTIRNSLLLLLAACIWGVAFVAQSAGMEHVGPFTFNACRFLLGGTVLLPLIAVRSRQRNAEGMSESKDEKKKRRRIALLGGICCGLAICTASSFQQMGIVYTSVGKAGFITTLYIIIVPIFGMFFGRKVRPVIWLGAVMAAAGLYLLCMNESFSLNKGDILVFVCAVLFSVHILVIDYFSPRADGVVLSCLQFYTSAIICIVLSVLFEQPSWENILHAAVPILYAGIMSCGVAYTLQIIGQKGMDPTVASLILSLESVVSVLAGWAILGQKLSRKELLGCAVVFAAVILVQLPERKRETTLTDL